MVRIQVNTLRNDRLKGVPESTTEANSFLGITRGNSDDVHTEIGIPLLGSPIAESILRVGASSEVGNLRVVASKLFTEALRRCSSTMINAI